MLQIALEDKLSHYRDPYLGCDYASANAIKRLTVGEIEIEIDIVLPYPFHGIRNDIEQAIKSHLTPISDNYLIKLNISSKIDAHVGKQGIKALPKIKNMIAVGSGKGGVGKSTVAVNMALALLREGARVGILDADIYGPSQPAMLGALHEKPKIEGKLLHPIMRHGLQSMSIGYLVDQVTPMVWRGPMLGKAIEQLLYDTLWEDLDYLVVDLPPGTGDVQLTLCQKMPLSGAVIVTTPQDLALMDVRRACEMFNKLNIPLLGVVENMSVFQCSQCGHKEHLFGEAGGTVLAQEYNLPVLASLPLDITIRQLTDSGHPPAAHQHSHPSTELFCELARKTAAKLALQPKDYSKRFPNVVVEQNK